MAKYARLPDGSLFPAAEGETYEQTMQAAYAKYPERFGAQEQTPAKKPSSVADLGYSALSGIGALMQFPGQVYGLATGDMDNSLNKMGQSVQDYAQSKQSEGLKQRQAAQAKAIEEAGKQGFLSEAGTAISTTLKDPILLGNFIAENIPNMIPGFGVTRGTMALGVKTAAKEIAKQGLEGEAAAAAMKAAQEALAKKAEAAAVGTAVAQQGADVGAQAYEDIYKKLKAQGASDADAASQALSLARSAGASGAVISYLSSRLPGARALEQSFAGAKGIRAGTTGFLKGAIGEGISEGVEEGGGQLSQNAAMRAVDPNQDILAGVGKAAGLGTVLGGVLGGGAGALNSSRVAQQQAQEEAFNAQKAAYEKLLAEQKALQERKAQLQDTDYLDGLLAKAAAFDKKAKDLQEAANVKGDDPLTQAERANAKRAKNEFYKSEEYRAFRKEMQEAAPFLKPHVEEKQKQAQAEYEAAQQAQAQQLADPAYRQQVVDSMAAAKKAWGEAQLRAEQAANAGDMETADAHTADILKHSTAYTELSKIFKKLTSPAPTVEQPLPNPVELAAQRETLLKIYREALASGKEARITQASADLRNIDEQLKRSEEQRYQTLKQQQDQELADRRAREAQDKVNRAAAESTRWPEWPQGPQQPGTLQERLAAGQGPTAPQQTGARRAPAPGAETSLQRQNMLTGEEKRQRDNAGDGTQAELEYLSQPPQPRYNKQDSLFGESDLPAGGRDTEWTFERGESGAPMEVAQRERSATNTLSYDIKNLQGRWDIPEATRAQLERYLDVLARPEMADGARSPTAQSAYEHIEDAVKRISRGEGTLPSRGAFVRSIAERKIAENTQRLAQILNPKDGFLKQAKEAYLAASPEEKLAAGDRVGELNRTVNRLHEENASLSRQLAGKTADVEYGKQDKMAVSLPREGTAINDAPSERQRLNAQKPLEEQNRNFNEVAYVNPYADPNAQETFTNIPPDTSLFAEEGSGAPDQRYAQGEVPTGRILATEPTARGTTAVTTKSGERMRAAPDDTRLDRALEELTPEDQHTLSLWDPVFGQDSAIAQNIQQKKDALDKVQNELAMVERDAKQASEYLVQLDAQLNALVEGTPQANRVKHLTGLLLDNTRERMAQDKRLENSAAVMRQLDAAFANLDATPEMQGLLKDLQRAVDGAREVFEGSNKVVDGKVESTPGYYELMQRINQLKDDGFLEFLNQPGLEEKAQQAQQQLLMMTGAAFKRRSISAASRDIIRKMLEDTKETGFANAADVRLFLERNVPVVRQLLGDKAADMADTVIRVNAAYRIVGRINAMRAAQDKLKLQMSGFAADRTRLNTRIAELRSKAKSAADAARVEHEIQSATFQQLFATGVELRAQIDAMFDKSGTRMLVDQKFLEQHQPLIDKRNAVQAEITRLLKRAETLKSDTGSAVWQERIADAQRELDDALKQRAEIQEQYKTTGMFGNRFSGEIGDIQNTLEEIRKQLSALAPAPGKRPQPPVRPVDDSSIAREAYEKEDRKYREELEAWERASKSALGEQDQRTLADMTEQFTVFGDALRRTSETLDALLQQIQEAEEQGIDATALEHQYNRTDAVRKAAEHQGAAKREDMRATRLQTEIRVLENRLEPLRKRVTAAQGEMRSGKMTKDVYWNLTQRLRAMEDALASAKTRREDAIQQRDLATKMANDVLKDSAALKAAREEANKLIAQQTELSKALLNLLQKQADENELLRDRTPYLGGMGEKAAEKERTEKQRRLDAAQQALGAALRDQKLTSDIHHAYISAAEAAREEAYQAYLDAVPPVVQRAQAHAERTARELESAQQEYEYAQQRLTQAQITGQGAMPTQIEERMAALFPVGAEFVPVASRENRNDTITEYAFTNADGEQVTVSVFRPKNDSGSVSDVKVKVNGEKLSYLNLGKQGIQTDEKLLQGLIDTDILQDPREAYKKLPRAQQLSVDKAREKVANAAALAAGTPTEATQNLESLQKDYDASKVGLQRAQDAADGARDELNAFRKQHASEFQPAYEAFQAAHKEYLDAVHGYEQWQDENRTKEIKQMEAAQALVEPGNKPAPKTKARDNLKLDTTPLGEQEGRVKPEVIPPAPQATSTPEQAESALQRLADELGVGKVKMSIAQERPPEAPQRYAFDSEDAYREAMRKHEDAVEEWKEARKRQAELDALQKRAETLAMELHAKWLQQRAKGGTDEKYIAGLKRNIGRLNAEMANIELERKAPGTITATSITNVKSGALRTKVQDAQENNRLATMFRELWTEKEAYEQHLARVENGQETQFTFKRDEDTLRQQIAEKTDAVAKAKELLDAATAAKRGTKRLQARLDTLQGELDALTQQQRSGGTDGLGWSSPEQTRARLQREFEALEKAGRENKINRIAEGQTEGRTGPATKKAVLAGDFVTGSEESKKGQKGQLATGSRNPVTEKPVQQRTMTAAQLERMLSSNFEATWAPLAEARTAYDAVMKYSKNEAAQKKAKERLDAAQKAYDAAKKRLDSFVGKVDEAGQKTAAEDAADAAEGVAADKDSTAFLRGADWDGIHRALDSQTAEHVRNGNLIAALQRLSKTGTTDTVRSLAAKLLDHVKDTTLEVRSTLRYEGKDVPGLYVGTKNHILLHKNAMTEEHLLHEALHAATMQAIYYPKTAAQKAALKRLQAMYEQIKKHKDFKDEYGATHFDEFVSEMYSTPELQAKLDAIGKPQSLLRRIWNGIKSLLGFDTDPDFNSKDAMAEIDKIMSPSGKLAAEDMTRAKRSAFEERTVESRSKAEQLWSVRGNAGLAARQAMADMRAALREVLGRGDKFTGMQAQASLLMADSYVGNAQAVAEMGAMKLIKDAKGYIMMKAGNSKSLVDVMKAIGQIPLKNVDDRMAKFQAYVTALRGEQVGFDMLDFKDAVGAERDARALLADIRANPELHRALQAAHEVYRDLNRGMIEFLKETHAIPEEVADKLLADKNYIPFYRERNGSFEMIMADGTPRAIGDIRSLPYLQALKGGDDKLMSFPEAALKNISILTNLGVQNMANRHIAYHLSSIGQAVPGKDKPMRVIPRRGNANDHVLRWNEAPDPNRPGDKGERHIVLETAGTIAEDIPLPLLTQAVAGTYATFPALANVANYASDLLRAGVTRNPAYVLRQLIKDPLNASLTGNLKSSPLTAVAQAVRNFFSIMRGTSVDEAALRKAGVLHSNVFAGGNNDLNKVALQIAGNQQGFIKRGLAGLDKMAMSADAATRTQAYKDAIASGASEAEAVVMARELANFQRRGAEASVQFLARVIPFFNASIQGLDATLRSAQGRMPANKLYNAKQRFFNRAMGLAGMAVMYSMAMEDDDEWKKMSLRDKISYIHIPRIFGEYEALRLPAPFEMGMMFYSMPMAMMEAMKGEFTPNDWQVVRDVFMSQMPGSGNLMPQLVKGAYDVSRNYDSFTGRPIVPKSLEGLDPTQQFTARTSEAAKRMAEGLNAMGVKLSPIQLEFLSNAYLGAMPVAVAQMTNDVFTPLEKANIERPTKHMSEMPVIGGFFQNKRGTEDVEHMYEFATQAKMANDTFKHLADTDPAAAKDYLLEHKPEIAMAKFAGEFTKVMGNFKKMEDLIRDNPRMDGDTKQAKLDQINQQRQKIAENFRAVLKRMPAPAQ